MSTPTTFKGLVDEILGLINLIVPLIFAFIFVFIVWKIFDAWVINAADEQKREEGKKYAVVAVLVIVVMTMVWGIVTLLRAGLFGI